MILTCPKCATRYTVPDTAVGKEGRMVRCAHCTHSWFETNKTLLDSVESKKPASPMSAASFLAAINPRKARSIIQNIKVSSVAGMAHNSPRWLRALCIILLVVVIAMTPFAYRKTIMESHPELAFLFEPFGIYYTDGLALADINLTITRPGDKKPHITVECSVINEAKGSRIMPRLKMIFFSSDGHEVARSPNLAETGKNMISGAQEPCKPFVLDTKDFKVGYVRADLGDPFDLALRHK